MVQSRDILEFLEMKILDQTIRNDEFNFYIDFRDGYNVTNTMLYKKIINEIKQLGF